MAVPPKVTPVIVPGADSSFTSVFPTETATSRSRFEPLPGVCENESVPPIATEALDELEVEVDEITLAAEPRFEM